MMHAYSGPNRVPLKEWQVQPFSRRENPWPKRFWTPARTERLNKLIAEGKSQRKIAELLGCTRSAVTAQICRLKREALASQGAA